MTAPSVLEATDTLAAYEFDLVCGWGTTMYPNRQSICTATADWLLLGHDCTQRGGLGEFLLCDTHLVKLRHNLDRAHTYCQLCGLRASTFAEWIYRVIGAR